MTGVGPDVLPAVVVAAGERPIHTPRAARLVEIVANPSDRVSKGDVLFRLEAPDLDIEIAKTERRLELVELRIGRASADDSERSDAIVLERERAALTVKLAGLQRERGELVVRAEADGDVLQVAADLHVGRWVGPDLELGVFAPDHRLAAEGYVNGDDADRLQDGATGVLIADDPLAPRLPVRLERIAADGAQSIALAELASSTGGPIGVEPNAEGELVPSVAHRRVTFSALQPSDGGPAGPALSRQYRGIVHLRGRPESFAARFVRHALKVLAREAGA